MPHYTTPYCKIRRPLSNFCLALTFRYPFLVSLFQSMGDVFVDLSQVWERSCSWSTSTPKLNPHKLEVDPLIKLLQCTVQCVRCKLWKSLHIKESWFRSKQMGWRKSPRRIPFFFQHEVQGLVQDMINRKVIMPYSSPWYIPLIWCEKVRRHAITKQCISSTQNWWWSELTSQKLFLLNAWLCFWLLGSQHQSWISREDCFNTHNCSYEC